MGLENESSGSNRGGCYQGAVLGEAVIRGAVLGGFLIVFFIV